VTAVVTVPLSSGQVRPARYLVAGDPAVVLTVFDVGLACCAVEFAAAVSGHLDLTPLTDNDEHDPAVADVLVVSGTVTDKLAPVVLDHYRRMPEPKRVVSFGSCANSGGPYWDSYCVTKGVDQMVPVDVYVPGCPPRPEALLQGLAALQETLRSVP
jgi:NADH-quinone oxidoreductase subunit B